MAWSLAEWISAACTIGVEMYVFDVDSYECYVILHSPATTSTRYQFLSWRCVAYCLFGKSALVIISLIADFMIPKAKFEIEFAHSRKYGLGFVHISLVLRCICILEVMRGVLMMWNLVNVHRGFGAYNPNACMPRNRGLPPKMENPYRNYLPMCTGCI